MARIPGIPNEYRVARIRRWQTPPNWSQRDWHDELDSIEAAAICHALLEFDEDRGVPVSAFVRRRVLTHAYTRYRQEWKYTTHLESRRLEDEAEIDLIPSMIDTYALCECLAALRMDQRTLLDQLYCKGCTESQIAAHLGISHQAVSKRKLAALRSLNECMETK